MAMSVIEYSYDVIVDLISSDSRPTFILDQSKPIATDQPSATTEPARIVFRNAALDTFVETLKQDSPSFETWASNIPKVIPVASVAGGVLHAGFFGGQDWCIKALKCGWRVAYCSSKSWTTSAHRNNAELPRTTLWSHHGSCDSTIAPFEGPLTDLLVDFGSDPYVSYIRNFDWENTGFGPMDTWPPALRSRAISIMSSLEPRFILWDHDMKMLYNEAAILNIGKSHPASLGRPLASMWGEGLHKQYVHMIRRGVEEGKAVPIRGSELITERNGYPEETYHDLQIGPIVLDNGRYGGAVMEYREVTSAVYQKNRQEVLAAISKCVSTTETLTQLWTGALKILEAQSQDIVYAGLWEPTDSDTPSDLQAETHFQLRASFGTENVSFFDGPHSNLVKSFEDARESIILLQTENGTLSPELAISVSRGAVCSAYIVPVTSGIGAKLAYMVLGMNPRRPIGESELFVTELRDLLAKSVSFVRLPEDRLRMEKANLALLDQLRLSKVKAEKNEEAFRRMGHRAPAGWFLFGPQGQPLYVNDAYLDIFGLTRDEFYQQAKDEFVWGRSLYEEDHQSAIDLMTRVFVGKENASFEYRIKTPPGAMPRWMEGTIFSELDESSNVVSFQGWVSDVSHRKYSESVKEERLQEALENKRAAERFLDMISHELRNPISSVLLLSEEMLTTLSQSLDDASTISADHIALMIDAAKTISLCALHQKNIADQVLTFSKLDSKLLVLVLETSHPLKIVESSLKIFTADLAVANIETSVRLLPNYKELGLVDVLMDSNRTTQVIINLLNNAIKFTRDSKVRNITVEIGAFKTKPAEGMLPLALVPHGFKDPRSSPLPSVSAIESADTDKEVYLQFSIKDTGCGLAQSEIGHIFNRFTQASPRTHRQYGGSGLGLLISKELVELHGGQIGVESTPGVGSTFKFYIKAHRVESASPDQVTQPSQPSHSLSLPPIVTPSLTLPVVGDQRISSSAQDMHVLIVEDNPINSATLKRGLQKAGCTTVYTAEHGQEALDFLATSSFSKSLDSPKQPLTIILLDIEMPVMDGITCIKRIRELQKTGELVRHVPVIATTANARQQQIDEAGKAGMDEVQTKPFKVVELVAHMQKLVMKWEGTG